MILLGSLPGMPVHGLTMIRIFGADSQLVLTMPNCPDGTTFGDSHLVSWINTVTASIVSMGIITQIYLVLVYTKFEPRLSALLGFFPMIEYWGMTYCTFWCSTWGPKNSGLGFLLLMPTHVLMTSRQITCNFTREPMHWFVKTPLLFLLLPLN